ncbi:Nucleoporin nup84 [Pleurotus pulmonarius]|nr:Nucleoporin nup84 [Pleurotus pulmonarius]
MEMALLANKSFWEGGEVTDDSSATIDIDREQEEEEWEKEVVGTLEGLKSVAVFEGQPADHAFHVSQLHIILDRTSTLLEIFANGLTDGIYADTSSDYSTMCRFFAHLCLFLQMIDIPVPPLATQVILEAYIRVLEGAGQRDLIAMYAGALGDNAIERYALFLTSLELSTDLSERRLALTRGMDHGLDLDRVAIATAERTIEKAFELLPPLAGPLPSIIAMQPPASETEQLLLRSIEWTTFSDATFHTALEQANVILRYFLGMGSLVSVPIFAWLTTEFVFCFRVRIGQGEPEEMATEYLHYQQFFAIWEALERVVECESLESPQMNRETKSAWLKDYAGLIDTAHEKIVKLLTSEWLVSDVDVITNDRRRRGLVRIRQLYIPELIIRLHHILVSSRHKIPSNAKLALKLANVVADSRYKLYDDFVGEGGIPLSEYLGAVRQAIIGGLEGGGSDPLRLLTRYMIRLKQIITNHEASIFDSKNEKCGHHIQIRKQGFVASVMEWIGR